MHLVVNNLGPISLAKFDLDKRISVFCGPNNTGKTYLSYVLYAFTRRILYVNGPVMDDNMVREFMVSRSVDIPLDGERLYDALHQRLTGISEDMSTVFGLTESKAKIMFPNIRLSVDLDKEAYVEMLKARELNFEIYLSGGILATVTKAAGDDRLKIENKKAAWSDEEKAAFQRDFFNQLFYRIVNSPIYGSHFFPVERNSLYTFHKDIYSNRSQMLDFLKGIDENKRQAALDFVERSSARYPLAINHTLEAANRMGQTAQERGYYADLADEMEQELLGGRLTVTPEGDVQFVSNKAPKKDIPLYLSASLAKAVSGLIFALRHVCGPEDMIFIDEPEVNCHPDVQILMTRMFARMANAGLRLIISTHSDYIVRELNNLIMLNGAFANMEHQLSEWGYTQQMKLAPQDVGAYLFEYGKNNRVNVKHIEVTESGFEVKTMDKAIAQLNEISESLYYELRYGHEN